MKRAILYYVSLALFFSINHVFITVSPVGGNPGKSARRTFNQETKNSVTASAKKHAPNELNQSRKSFYSNCDDGDGDDESIEDCILECKWDYLLNTVEAITILLASAVVCSICVSTLNPGPCAACVAGLVEGSIQASQLEEKFQECKEECVEG